MRIQSKKNNSKTKIAIAILVCILIISGIVLGYFQLFKQGNQSSDRKDSDISNGTDTDLDKPADGPTESPQNTDNGDKPNDSGYQTITPSDVNQPKKDATFPIETAEYRIEMTNDSSFKITLYPIEGPDYDAQLRNYKTSALDYLKNRFGSLDRYTINWMPESARSI